MHVTIEQAEKAIEAARKRALELDTQMCIAVVNSGANLKGFYRMDDAWVGSIDIAMKKAKTAVFFGMPTGQIGKLSQPGGPLFGIEISNDGLITFPGGLPIVDANGVMIGGRRRFRQLGRERSCRRGSWRQRNRCLRSSRASLAHVKCMPEPAHLDSLPRQSRIGAKITVD